jgi:mRNA interferase MazF
MICDPFDVVEVPYPFTDPQPARRRKALVLSSVEFNAKNRSSVLLVLTSDRPPRWQRDVALEAWAQAGLRKPCIARMKLFTLPNDLILDRVGSAHEADRKRIAKALRKTLGV